jgi:hypothetical protein
METGTQTSARRPGMAAMNAGSSVTSGMICGRPVLTTRPMTPVAGVNPSDTWK